MHAYVVSAYLFFRGAFGHAYFWIVAILLDPGELINKLVPRYSDYVSFSPETSWIIIGAVFIISCIQTFHGVRIQKSPLPSEPDTPIEMLFDHLRTRSSFGMKITDDAEFLKQRSGKLPIAYAWSGLTFTAVHG
jgi:hypothetical protein